MISILAQNIIMIVVVATLSGIFLGWYISVPSYNLKKWTKWKLINMRSTTLGSDQTLFLYRRTNKKSGMHEYKVVRVNQWFDFPDKSKVTTNI